MGGHLFPDIPCKLCSKPVDLSADLSADENGKAVHEECYVKHITIFPATIRLAPWLRIRSIAWRRELEDYPHGNKPIPKLRKAPAASVTAPERQPTQIAPRGRSALAALCSLQPSRLRVMSWAISENQNEFGTVERAERR